MGAKKVPCFDTHFMVKVVTLQRHVSNQTHSDSVIYQGHVPWYLGGSVDAEMRRRHVGGPCRSKTCVSNDDAITAVKVAFFSLFFFLQVCVSAKDTIDTKDILLWWKENRLSTSCGRLQLLTMLS